MSETETANPEAEPEKEADHHPYRRPVDAATLILVDRTGATPKVLVGKRHDKVVFQPGKIVFPGGRVDPSDARVPVAAPIPAPMMAASAIGVGRTRAAPYLVCKPLDVAKTPPGGSPMSSPSKNTFLSFSSAISCALRMPSSIKPLLASPVGAVSASRFG